MTILLITGCGKKVDLTKIKDEMSKKDNYQMDINVKGNGKKQDITVIQINDKNYEIIVTQKYHLYICIDIARIIDLQVLGIVSDGNKYKVQFIR